MDISQSIPDLVKKISSSVDVSETIAELLVNRGLKSPQQAEKFINPNLDDVHNPFLLKDMPAAIERIRKAILKREKILIWGDQDVDGITSIAIMLDGLKQSGATVTYFIPDDYGMDKQSIQRWKREGIDLIITVDCGISAGEEVKYASQLGLDVIVTDHHEQGETLPEAIAVINPKRKDGKYPFPEISGCLVAFKVIQALNYSFTPWYGQEMVAVDLETTGLDPAQDDILEIGAVKVKNGIILERFSSLINPQRPIPPQITQINGIDDELVKDAPGIEETLPKFLQFIEKAPLIMHNADFDLSFLQEKTKKYLARQIQNQVVDTLTTSRARFPSISHKLEQLARNLGVRVSEGEGYHRALNDALATALIQQKLDGISSKKTKDRAQKYLDLVALGTIADCMPLLDENRVFVKYGLRMLYHSAHIGLRELIRDCGLDRTTPRASQIAQHLAPLLNSCGRMDCPEVGLQLLLTEDEKVAESLVKKIGQLNARRQEVLTRDLARVQKILPQQCDLRKDKILIIVSDQLNPKIAGIVAFRLVDKYHRPVIIIFISAKEEARGIARSTEEFDIFALLKKCSDLFVKFGGHKKAAGFTIKTDKIEEFRNRSKEIASHLIPPESLISQLKIEKEIEPALSALTNLAEDLRLLEPYGAGNPQPIFKIPNLLLKGYWRVGQNNQHLRVKLGINNHEISGIGWRMGKFSSDQIKNARVDVVSELAWNWKFSQPELYLVLKDIKPHLKQDADEGRF